MGRWRKLRQCLTVPHSRAQDGGLKEYRHRAPTANSCAAWEAGGHGAAGEAIQEAVVAVGAGPVRAVRRPARACPGDKETPWLWGECAAPALRRGH